MTHPQWSSDKTADLSNLKETMRSIYNRCSNPTYIPYDVFECSHCWGVMDYIYGTWWKCRDCGTWGQKNA